MLRRNCKGEGVRALLGAQYPRWQTRNEDSTPFSLARPFVRPWLTRRCITFTWTIFSLVFPSLLSLLALRFCLVAYQSQAGACMNNVIGLLASPGLVGQTSSLIHLTSPRQRQQFQSSRIGASGQTRRLDKVLRFLVPAEKRWWD